MSGMDSSAYGWDNSPLLPCKEEEKEKKMDCDHSFLKVCKRSRRVETLSPCLLYLFAVAN